MSVLQSSVCVLQSTASVLRSMLGDWWVIVFVIAVVAVLAWNGYDRVRWELAWQASGKERMDIPERRWTYDERDLEEFAAVAGEEMLASYVSILRRSDICFAIALAAITAFVWYRIAVTPLDCDGLNWAALPFGAMAILYGIADVTEDMKLAAILRHPRSIDRAEAAATSTLTRLKRVTLLLSVIGVVIFLIDAVAQACVVRLRRPKPVVA
jgi:hypothetical protein